MSKTRQPKRKPLRSISDPFVVAPAAGARIRTRLFLLENEPELLTQVGTHQGTLLNTDLKERISVGNVLSKDNQRTERKRRLTAQSSSRWAGSITRASEDQYQLSLRALAADITSLKAAIKALKQRLVITPGEKVGKLAGYKNSSERFRKNQRLQVLEARLMKAEERLTKGHPSIVRGSKQLLKKRSNLKAANLTETRWRAQWEAKRMFLTADGESGKRYGNETIRVSADGELSLKLPKPLAHLSPGGRLTLSNKVSFSYRSQELLERIEANKNICYSITHDTEKDRWYLDASWGMGAEAPSLEEATGGRVLAVDLNDGHLACGVLSNDGNLIGKPVTIVVALKDLPASTRDGHLRAAITHLIHLAKENDCKAIVIENLGFVDARSTGRETMGRGSRGKAFRKTVAGIPTAKFRERLVCMASREDLAIIAVDPAYDLVHDNRATQFLDKSSLTK